MDATTASDMSWNGSSAMDGLSGSVRAWVVSTGDLFKIAAELPVFILNRHARIGSTIFFRFCGPMSSKAISTLPRT
jgi:hypothetical protein